MTLRDNIENVLRGEIPSRLPFTIYENKLPQCAAERQLRNSGLTVVNRNVPVLKTFMPNVKCREIHYHEKGKNLIRTEYDTPLGQLNSVSESVGFTSWIHQRIFKSSQDYKAIFFMINDMQFEPNYQEFIQAEKDDGGDSIFRGNIGLEPLQLLISEYMGAETFCMEWHDNRDEILKLYDVLVSKHRIIYKLCANSPALIFNYGGNVTPEILGLERFKQYYIPHYNEAAEELHKKGKLIGVHFDANCRLIANAISESLLDYVEAFTPSPDTDMTLSEARQAWPEKVLWVNFPSSIHLESLDVIERTMLDLLKQAKSPHKFIMGITEDMPQDRWRENLNVIISVIHDYAW